MKERQIFGGQIQININIINKIWMYMLTKGLMEKFNQIRLEIRMRQLFNLRREEGRKFLFERRILNHTANEEIMFYKEFYKTTSVKVEIETKDKDPFAYHRWQKLQLKNELKKLKRRKIDKIVAGKIVKINVNIDLKDSEERKLIIQNDIREKETQRLYQQEQRITWITLILVEK